MKSVVITGEFPEYSEFLKKQGFNCILTEPDSRLQPPVSFHPDMQFCKIGGTLLASRGNPLIPRIKALGVDVNETEASPQSEYPKDVICNAFAVGENLFAHMRSIDGNIVKAAENNHLKLIDVKQGYAACSTLILNSSSIISADEGICAKAIQKNIECLMISAGGIILDGYNTGFIGGCAAQLGKTVYFTGKLNSHRDGRAIREFISRRWLNITEITDNALHDIGGIIPLN